MLKGFLTESYYITLIAARRYGLCGYGIRKAGYRYERTRARMLGYRVEHIERREQSRAFSSLAPSIEYSAHSA